MSGATGSAFTRRTVVVLLVVGIGAFVATLLLGAFAPDFRSGQNGGGHALSNGATGFAGIVRLAEATGRPVEVSRSDRGFATDGLLIVTPESGGVDISDAIAGRDNKPTLFVFPKWETAADPLRRGWVRSAGIKGGWDAQAVLAPAIQLAVRTHKGGLPIGAAPGLKSTFGAVTPRPAQVIIGPAGDWKNPVPIHPLLVEPSGGMLLARIGDGPRYVLADPDLMSNQGIRDVRQAVLALAVLDRLRGGRAIVFDVTLNGLGHSPSPLKLLFQPPFLALTLGVAVALLLAGWQAPARFGPVRVPPRAIAFGKAALVDNAAALVRKARREAALGPRYVAVIRDRAVAAFGVPGRLRGEAIDTYLDNLRGGGRFTALAGVVERADRRSTLLDAARALHSWYREKRRDR
jgi:hypothetical protein